MGIASSAKLLFLSASRRLRFGGTGDRPVLVIVIYHRVGSGTDTPIDVPVGVFESQLDYLQDHYEIVPLDAAVHAVKTSALRRSTAVLTFDDGYYDFYTTAAPVLARRGLPATLYVATHFVETGEPFPWDRAFAGRAQVRPLTWKELAGIARLEFVTIGSHTHTHPRLDRISVNAIEREITVSNRLIGDRLGVRAAHFACPSGISSPLLPPLARRYYRSVAVAGWRPNLAGAIDPFGLQRIPALPTADLALFAHSLSGAAWPLDVLAKLRLALSRSA